MIIALEGSDGVGKSSAAELLRTRLNLTVFADQVRHGLLGDLDAEGMFIAGNQCNLDLTALSRVLHLVADRWALSSVVYDCGLRGISRDRYLKLMEIYARASAWVFLLDCPPAVARERVSRRDGAPRRSLEEMERIRDGFFTVAEWWRELGGNLTLIPTADREATNRVLLTNVELALLHAGRAG